MKLFITLVAILYFSSSFSQWTRVQQLPSSDIFNLYRKDSILYAGGRNIIYFSRNKGQTWDSTSRIPLTSVDNIISFRNELYASSFAIGVFKSPDGGGTWQNISAGVFPFISDFCEWNGDLYAATLGGSVYKLDPVNRNNWLSFNNGLSSLSLNLNSIAANSNALIAGTLANGLYDYLPSNSTSWEERFLLGQISPSEGVYDIITGHDSLFLAGSSGRFYMSLNNGLNWNIFGDRLRSTFTSLVNAKQALLLGSNSFDGVNNNTSFSYIKKDGFQGSFVPFSTVTDHYTYRLEIFGNKLWDASTRGLFYMPLSELEGITAADDSVNLISLPVDFTVFHANCQSDQVLITWKTAREQNSGHFNIERSPDGIRWTVIGNLPAAGNSASETSYSFTDNTPLPTGYYRIAEYDLDEKVQYSSVAKATCNARDGFSLWPNPARDIVFINIDATASSQAIIKIFDSKGVLVQVKRVALIPGNNQLQTDLGPLASGMYTLSATWLDGQMQKTVRVVKH